MNTLTLTLPDSLHSQLKKLAEKEGISLDQLASVALAEKIAALMPDYLIQRGARGSRHRFEQVLQKVADTEPDQQDKLSQTDNHQELDSLPDPASHDPA